MKPQEKEIHSFKEKELVTFEDRIFHKNMNPELRKEVLLEKQRENGVEKHMKFDPEKAKGIARTPIT